VSLEPLSGFSLNTNRLSYSLGTSVGWDTRMDLSYDIGENSILKLKLLIVPEMEVKGGALQVSFVQEGVF
jgi:hypothetical protein